MEELWEEIIKWFTDQGVTRELAIAYIIVAGLIVIVALIALVMRIIIVIKYLSTNRTQTKDGRSCIEVARKVLDENNMQYVQIKKASLIRAWIWGNSFSITKKTIFLRGTIYGKNSLTAVGLALQKVGVAKLVEKDSKMARVRNIGQIIGLFGPILIVPIILIGAFLDIFLLQGIGYFSWIAIGVSGALLILGAVVTFLNIPVEKRANDMAMEMLEKGNICTPEEKDKIKNVLDTYIIAYVLEFILTILRVVQLVLEIIMNIQMNSSNGN